MKPFVVIFFLALGIQGAMSENDASGNDCFVPAVCSKSGFTETAWMSISRPVCEADLAIKGKQGEIGPRGQIGPIGLKGEEGPQGDVGLSGPKGDIGTSGENGSRGEVGGMGPTGMIGQQGEAGIPGPKGGIGPMGLKGEEGPQGDVGPLGPKGDLGTSGEKGSKGEVGGMGPTGGIGQQGAAGIPGPRGGIGTIGLKGEEGPQGDVGPLGPKGGIGPKGEPASVDSLAIGKIIKVLCPVKHGNKCFFPVIARSVDYDGGVALCDSRLGAHLANIYSQIHMIDVGKYIRENLIDVSSRLSFRLGMKYDPKYKKLTLRDGTDAPAGLVWSRGSPLTVSISGIYGGFTSVILSVRSEQSSTSLYNQPPSSTFYVLCEIE